MIRKWLNWRSGLALVAVIIVIATIFYSRYLANKIATDERQKVEAWAEAQKYIAKADPDEDILFATLVMAGQASIPVIETNEKDSITNYHNIDSLEVKGNSELLAKRLREFGRGRRPIITYIGNDSTRYNKYYYGESLLLKEVKYYPIVQLIIVALFIIITLVLLNTQHKSSENQLWAGMAKETAHQLGTPVSALEGWLEMLRESQVDQRMIQEMGKDVSRLKLVSDRFGKIGSAPSLEFHDPMAILQQVVEYIRKRAPQKVKFEVIGAETASQVNLSPPLFEWVVENLLKNALDAMDGQGLIKVELHDLANQVQIDITDTGKGIPASMLPRVFNAGFTTKKRGWGLGLTLSKRIIEQYHKGELFVKQSEPGKGTTFRIVLKK